MEQNHSLSDWILDHPKLAGFGAAIALAVTFSPRVSAMAAWLCVIVSVLFAVAMLIGVAKRKQWRKPTLVGGCILVIVALLGFGGWLTGFKIRDIPPIQPTSIAVPHVPSASEIADELAKRSPVPRTPNLRVEPAFSVAVETRIIAPPGGEYDTSYWVAGNAPGGCSLEPAQAALFIRITNLQTKRALITGYTVEAFKVPLTRMKMDIYKAFHITRKGVIPSSNVTASIQVPVPQKGAIGSLVTFKVKEAYPAEARPVLNELLDQQISGHYLEPNQTIRGWSFFRYPPGAGLPAQMVIEITDETGHDFRYPIPDSGGDQNADVLPRLITLGPTVDLSGCKMRL